MGFFDNVTRHSNNENMRWSMNPHKFDNNYYQELLTKDTLMMRTPSDDALLQDGEYLEHIEIFARDKNAFFEEFTKVYQKLGRLGNGKLYSENINQGVNNNEIESELNANI